MTIKPYIVYINNMNVNDEVKNKLIDCFNWYLTEGGTYYLGYLQGYRRSLVDTGIINTIQYLELSNFID